MEWISENWFWIAMIGAEIVSRLWPTKKAGSLIRRVAQFLDNFLKDRKKEDPII